MLLLDTETPFLTLVFLRWTGKTEITMIQANIMNDLSAEYNETFSMRISAADGGGTRHNFECYDDGEDSV